MNEHRYRETERRLYESVGLTPSERRIRLGSTGAQVRVMEVGEGEPVLFVHGTNNAGAGWAPMVAHFSGYRSIVLDRPGCGLSDPNPSPTDSLAELERYADGMLADVIDGLGLGAAKMVSTSLGGYFALRGAAAHPDRISALVELAYPVGAPSAVLPLIMRIGAIRSIGRISAKIPPTTFAIKSVLKQIGLGDAMRSGVVSDSFIAWFKAMVRDTNTMVNEMNGGAAMGSFKGFDPAVYLSDELLSSITCPSYFLWGTNDIMGGPEIARAFVQKIPGAELELMEGAGHAPFLDDPAQVAEVVQRFFAANSTNRH